MSAPSSARPIGRGTLLAALAAALIGLTEGSLARFEFIGPGEALAHPWRLLEPNGAWIGCALHNLAVWAVIAAARGEGRVGPSGPVGSTPWFPSTRASAGDALSPHRRAHPRRRRPARWTR